MTSAIEETETDVVDPKPRRPLRILDLMALVMAIALTWITPAIMKGIVPLKSHHVWDRRQFVVHMASLILFWWTAVLFGLIVAESRANLRRDCQSFGRAAIISLMVVWSFSICQQLILAVGLTFLNAWPNQNFLGYYWLFMPLEDAAIACGAAVATAWLVLFLIRTEHPPTTWFDKLCFTTGITWIVWGLAKPLIYHLPIRWLTTSGIWY